MRQRSPDETVVTTQDANKRIKYNTLGRDDHSSNSPALVMGWSAKILSQQAAVDFF